MPSIQSSLFPVTTKVGFGALGSAVDRTVLSDGAWIDIRREWLAGAEELFERLRRIVPWQEERRWMYGRMVEVPRLQAFYDEGMPLPDALLEQGREMLSDQYREELGEPFQSTGMCLYRDGRDSVSWHGDTIGRGATEDTLVAILSLGATRCLRLRPRQGGATQSVALATGDLLVMGGSCQRTWEHAVTKSTRPVGERLSVQFRPRGVR
jgi:alkylated DNA repair dioxygenase AlkB